MDNITITILCSVVSAAVAWFSAINTVKKNTAEETCKITTLQVLIEQQTGMIRGIEKKLEDSGEDRRKLHVMVTAMGEQITTLFNNDKLINERLDRIERGGN